jgi:serine/threonine-protein kinase
VRGPLTGGEGGKLTLRGAIAGTPAFMSPEQAAGRESVDGRSDLYSLGAVAYHLLAGRPPFVREAAVEAMAAHLRETAPPPPGPEDLQAVVLRCLEKDPRRRFADAGAMEEALARCGCAGGWTKERAERWWQAHPEARE